MRRAVIALLNFGQTTGYTHQNQELFINNYRSILKAMGLNDDQVREKLENLIAPYGMSMNDM